MSDTTRFVACLALTIGFVAVTTQAFAVQDAPKVDTALPAAPTEPYNINADAHAEVAAAVARAAQNHKFVLIDFGGNWCPDCRVTAGVLAMDQVKPWVADMFELVMVDVGRMTKNLDIGEAYGVHVKAVPTMIVLDPAGRMINRADNAAALSDARGMTPQAIVDTLHGWIQTRG